MLTARAWWFLLPALGMLGVGIGGHFLPVTLVGLTLVLWFGCEWLVFTVRSLNVARQARVHREVGDERGPVTTLWAGRTFEVRVGLHLAGLRRLPHAAITDLIPYGVEHEQGSCFADGEVRYNRPLELTYRIRCTRAGLVRFEGLRVQLADLQGFFYHVAFVRAPVVLRVLPMLAGQRGQHGGVKRYNLLPPPGTHRLRQAGSGSELLDLRDYIPGDPPKTIAWKISARRDRLITKEFESEVPCRCTLFVDTSNSVRLSALAQQPPASGEGRQLLADSRKPMDRLIEIASSVLQANASIRDLTGVCLFDEQTVTMIRPERKPTHVTRVLQLLADAAALAPRAARIDPDSLLPLAYSFAQEVYPDALRPEVNALPGWLNWLIAFPRYSRRRRTWREWLYRHKRRMFFLLPPLLSLTAYLFPALAGLVVAAVFLLPVPVVVGVALVFLLPVLIPSLLYLLILLVNRRLQRVARWRKRLAALLAVRHGLGPGGLESLLEDDDCFALHLQRFLAEHQVPYSLPLYDPAGRYLHAAPEKVSVLADALLQAVGRAHDNELFVLLADLLEVEVLEPLLAAVAVALSQHHQVILVCPWPPGLPLPAEEPVLEPPEAEMALRPLVYRVTTQRFHTAYQRIRRAFARLGVPVACAAGDEPVPLILNRLNRLRTLGRRW
jgi:uncharacterized protein (DUF58 family)